MKKPGAAESFSKYTAVEMKTSKALKFYGTMENWFESFDDDNNLADSKYSGTTELDIWNCTPLVPHPNIKIPIFIVQI